MADHVASMELLDSSDEEHVVAIPPLEASYFFNSNYF